MLQLTKSGDEVRFTAKGGTGTSKFLQSVVCNERVTAEKLTISGSAPSSKTDSGSAGEIRVSGAYLYICTATNTWVRVQGSEWS